jgi:hypothetical protein
MYPDIQEPGVNTSYTSDLSLAKVQHLALPPSRWHGSPMSPGRDPDLKPAHCQSYSL